MVKAIKGIPNLQPGPRLWFTITYISNAAQVCTTTAFGGLAAITAWENLVAAGNKPIAIQLQ